MRTHKSITGVTEHGIFSSLDPRRAGVAHGSAQYLSLALFKTSETERAGSSPGEVSLSQTFLLGDLSC